MVDKLTEWKNEPKYKDLNDDKVMATDAHNTYKVKLAEYRETLAGGKKIVVKKGKSDVRPLLTRKLAEWKKPALVEPFLSTRDLYKVSPRTGEDGPAAEQNQIMLNYYMAVKVPKLNLVESIAHTLVDEGTATVKSGWYSEYATETVQVMKPVYASPEESPMVLQQLVQAGQISPEKAQAMMETGEPVQISEEMVEEEQEVLVENKPTFEVCVNDNIIVDPTAMGVIEDMQFMIHEYESDMASLKVDEYDKKTGKGFYQNLADLADKLKYGQGESLFADAVYENDTQVAHDSFKFGDKARKKIKLSEYWGYWDIHNDGTKVGIVATWAEGIMIRMEENPFPHGRLPFSKCTYLPVKGQYHGEPDAALLKENQESIGKMTRAYHDITSTRAVGQKIIPEDTFSGPAEWAAYDNGDDARSRPGVNLKNAIYETNVQPVDSSVFQVIQMQMQDAESLTGVRAFNSAGGGNQLGASATAVRNSMDATSKRELAILQRMSIDLFQDLGRKTIVNMQAYAAQEEVVRVTAQQFVTVRREDLKGEFDLVIEVSTPEKDAEQAQQLMTLLQSNQANMDLELQKILYSKLLTLWHHPDVADQVEAYSPKPDPVQQELVQQQLENAKLENKNIQMNMAKTAKELEEMDSKIRYRDSASVENLQADIKRKQAQADENIARKEYLEAQTDALDQEYLMTQDGTKRQHQVNDLQFAADIKAENEKLKSDTMLANKTVGEK